MTPERWRDVERIYHEARRRDPSQRAEFLRDACAGDESVRADVESLLAHREEAAAFLEAPAAELASRHGSHATIPPRDSIGAEGGEQEWPDIGSGDDLDLGRRSLRRAPWWIWCCLVPAILGAGGICWVILTGPEPAGWTLMPTASGGTAWGRRVAGVAPGSTAERAGFAVNDVVSGRDIDRLLARRQPGIAHRFDLVRNGQRQVLTLRLRTKDLGYWVGARGRVQLGPLLTSALCLGLGALLALARPHDRAARWGALLTTQLGFLVAQLGPALGLAWTPEAADAVRSLPLPVATCVLVCLSLSMMVPAGAFGFCAAFPRPSRLSPWVWGGTALAASTTIPIDLSLLWLPVYAGDTPQPEVLRTLAVVSETLGLIYLAWALLLLARSYRRVEAASERRRLRIVAVGLAASLLAMALLIVTFLPWAPIEEFRFRRWAGSAWQLMHLALFSITPVCLAYAILRHRVFDIHVIVRLGVRYAVARGALLSLVPLTGLALVLDVAGHREQTVGDIVGQRGPWYLALAGAAVLLHARRKAWMDALDRRFFRESYDARRLLSGIVDDVRRAGGFEEAARHVTVRLDSTLHPESVSLMVRNPGDPVFRAAAGHHIALPVVSADAKLVDLARLLSEPLEIHPSRSAARPGLPRGEVELLRRARIEWLFPVSLRAGATEAFLLLGPKRSEEPYSREDRDLLAAIAGSLGLVLERPAGGAGVRPGFAECTVCGTCYDPGIAGCADHGATLVKSPYARVVAGRYRLDRRLGRGGMGTVYEAFDRELARQVAVKVVRPDVMESPEAIARFRREAKAAASLSHPHVVTVFDFGVAEDDRAYLVMERLRGRSLREELRERGPLEPARAKRILRDVAAAAALAHQRGLLHRDLKPENIFLAQGESGEVAKILDFGLVRPLAPGATETAAQTAPGAVLGTLAYMSPEQRRGEPPAESWDIWALALVAFETLTGAHPFTASSGSAASSCDGDGDLALRAGRRRLPAGAEAFFDRALSIDPAQRPASVVQLIEDLAAALHDAPEAGRPRPVSSPDV